ncbi:MAG: RNA polymerase sigma factor [Myxococcaceae bacterium]|nr:RNA polymerase sigma factor [Myxococcaceae bacterium]
MPRPLATGATTYEAALAEAKAAWPKLRVDTGAFERRWRELADDDGPAPLAIDLYFAQACLEGDPQALAQLQQQVVAQLQLLSHFRFSREDQEELAQQVMTALLVAGPKGRKLGQFAARAPLHSWLRMLLSRAAIDRLRTSKGPPPADEDVLLGLPGPQRDAELESLKAKYKGHFSEVFRFAIKSLTPRQRNLLRQHYLDDLTLEELAALYKVHRATVARWMQEARLQVMAVTREELARRTGIPRAEVDSVMQVVQSRLELSAAFFLSVPAGPASG